MPYEPHARLKQRESRVGRFFIINILQLHFGVGPFASTTRPISLKSGLEKRQFVGLQLGQLEFWDTFSYLKIIELSVLPPIYGLYHCCNMVLQLSSCLGSFAYRTCPLLKQRRIEKVQMSHPKESRTLKFWSPSTVHLNPCDSLDPHEN